MANEEPAPCFIVMGIVIIVFDLIILESTYLMYLGAFFIFLGIIFIIISNSKKQRTKPVGVVHSQPQQQSFQKSFQNVVEPILPPEIHKFCPYCGKETSLEICPDCGKEID